MAANIEETIIEKVRALPLEKQREILEFVENLEKRTAEEEASQRRPIWEVIEEISNQIPLEEWDKIPSDGSLNVDHYLYGAPKKIK